LFYWLFVMLRFMPEPPLYRCFTFEPDAGFQETPWHKRKLVIHAADYNVLRR